jgi:hypothetical protein
MFQDRSISPKAKGVLGYLLSLPNDWKVYHKQLMYALNIGEEYLNSAIEELINAGYIRRSRQRVKGVFQPYSYEIAEFKIFLPNGENQPGFSSPENPVLQKKKTLPESIQKKQQQPTADFAAAFSKVKDLDISEDEKKWIAERYKPAIIQNAIDYCSKAKIKTSYIQTLKWACEKHPIVPRTPKENEDENRKYAENVVKNINPTKEEKKKWSIEILSKSVEIVYHTSQKLPFVLSYSESDFKNKFDSELKRLRT